MRRRAILGSGGFALLSGSWPAQFSWAQEAAYPSRPVQMVVAIQAGGAIDVAGRTVAEAMGSRLGQTFFVDNRPGAGGLIGMTDVARSKADGYNLLFGTAGPITILPQRQSVFKTIDPVKAFVPVALLYSVPMVVIIKKNSRFKNLRELIDYAKANPGKLTFGTAGSGSSMHLFMEVLKMMTATDITHVPYKGSGPAGQDVMGNQITMVFDSMPGAWPFVQSGRFRALAVSSGKRAPNAPDVPTVAEAGVPGYDSVSWLGLVGPAGMPRDLVMRINADTNRLLQTTEVKDRFDKLGTVPVGGTPEEFGAYIRTQVATWHKVVRASGAKVE